MKKISLLLSLLALCFNIAFANPIDPEKALETANRFWNSQIKETGDLILKSPKTMSKAGSRINVQEHNPQYYICTPENGGGFIIISGDDALAPIVAYSTEAVDESSEMPTVLIEWLNEYCAYVNEVRTGTIKPAKKVTRASKTAIAPMLKTTWNQMSPYNNLCPEINGQKTPTGCTATAMAQIMKFHEWPITPKKAITWKSNITGKTENIDLTKRKYNWDNMLDHYRNGYTAEQAQEVAQLMVDVGKAIESSYSLQGTGSNDFFAANALVNIFGYSTAIQTIKRTNITEEKFIAKIRENLAARKPVLYTGTSLNYEGGHAFVCDGIDENDLLHIDWGWDGAYNGYFDMTYMSPAGIGTGGGSGSYNVAQGIIVDIAPSKADDVNSSEPVLYQTAIFQPDTDTKLYNYTTTYSNNRAKFRAAVFILNISHSILDVEFALGVENKDNTYRILVEGKTEGKLGFFGSSAYYVDFGIDIADKTNAFYFEKGTHTLKILYKDSTGNYTVMEGEQNRLMLDVNETSAKMYMALPDINVSSVELTSETPRIGSKVGFNAKFINNNTHNSTVVVVPILNTTLANGTVVRDTLKNSKKLFDVLDKREIFVKFETSDIYKNAGKCHITFAYNLDNYYVAKNYYNPAEAESVSGKSNTFTVKDEEAGGVPIVTSVKASNIKNGKTLDISATVTNQTYFGYKYSGNVALAIQNTSNNDMYILAKKEGVELEKNKSLSLSYKSSDYFPTLAEGNYEVIMCEKKGNKWEKISQSAQKTFSITNDTIGVPYLSDYTSVSKKSVMPGDSVDVDLTVSSFGGTFNGYIRVITLSGLTPVLRSNHIPVTINDGESHEITAECLCGSTAPEGQWTLIIKYYDKNKRELDVMSNNTFTFPGNDYFWVGNPPAGIENVTNEEIYVTVNDNILNIHGVQQGSEIAIYRLDGRTIYNGYETNISVDKGIYIICVDKTTIIKAAVK